MYKNIKYNNIRKFPQNRIHIRKFIFLFFKFALIFSLIYLLANKIIKNSFNEEKNLLTLNKDNKVTIEANNTNINLKEDELNEINKRIWNSILTELKQNKVNKY